MTQSGYNGAELNAMLKRAFDRYAGLPGKAAGSGRRHAPDPGSVRRAYRRFERGFKATVRTGHPMLKTLAALAACLLLALACLLKLATPGRDDLVVEGSIATAVVGRNMTAAEEPTSAPSPVGTVPSIAALPSDENETNPSAREAKPTMTATPMTEQTQTPIPSPSPSPSPTPTPTSTPVPSPIPTTSDIPSPTPTPSPTLAPTPTPAATPALYLLSEPKAMEFYIENRVGTLYELYVYPVGEAKGKARNTGLIKYGETFTVSLTAEECAKGGLWRISVPQSPGSSEVYAFDSNGYTLSELLGRSFVLSREVENWGMVSVKFFFTEQSDETQTAAIPESFFRVVNRTGKNMTELYLGQDDKLTANLLFGWLYDGQKCSVQVDAECFASDTEVNLTVGLKATRGSFPWGWPENNRADMVTLSQTASLQTLFGHTVIFTLDAGGQPEYRIE